MSLFLNASHHHLFYQDQAPMEVRSEHRPSLLAFSSDGEDATSLKARLEGLWKDAKEGPLTEIDGIEDPIPYQSFWNHGGRRDVVPVRAKESYKIPEISDALFFDHGCYTAEHDIPYRERLLADRVSTHDEWILDTKGKEASLDVLTYDIETTQYEDGKKDVPIDMVGWSEFDVHFESQKDLDSEQLDFRFTGLEQDWEKRQIDQEIARNENEEIDLLRDFTKRAVEYDVVSGHNILGFDNKQIHDRIQWYLRRNESKEILEGSTKQWFDTFLGTYSKTDRSFHFGTSQEIAVWYPMTLDTFHAARKFFFFHDDFTLKGLAPWLGIHVEDRQYLSVEEMKLDDATKTYNEHDVREQLGLTQNLIAQALPLCFTVNLPMDELLTGGNTKMWDHMALIRARRERRFMPATSRAMGVCRTVQYLLPNEKFPKREQVAEVARSLRKDERDRHREFVRVAKQGPEMPFWVEHPMVIANPGQGADTGYEIVGGLTLKPDSDLQSHFVPWFHVYEADVGAMYPTILKARNYTADTVRPALIDETPDEWVWLFHVHEEFVKSGKYHIEAADKGDAFTRGRGFLVGMKRRKEEGLTNLAMTGILDTIQKVKDARAAAKASGDEEKRRILDMTYASLKAARNAGTHGIMVAVNVSCRQFNVWGGSAITTLGQKILHETKRNFEELGIRVVYGDTDGIYVATSRSIESNLALAEAVGVEPTFEGDPWLVDPKVAEKAIEDANRRWRAELEYDGFELEREQSDAMVFIVHKNYLKFSAKDGKLLMDTKGNNFKGSDKAPIARTVLESIMKRALAECSSWTDEDAAREAMKLAIKRATKEVMKDFDVRSSELDLLTLRQQVQPVKRYKPNADGTASNFAVRTAALEHLLEEAITANRKMRFVVCKRPLPAYERQDAKEWLRDRLTKQNLGYNERKITKASVKPIEWMWPLDLVKPDMIDWDWYRDTIEAYVKGAFGFDNLELAVQRDLSSWF